MQIFDSTTSLEICVLWFPETGIVVFTDWYVCMYNRNLGKKKKKEEVKI